MKAFFGVWGCPGRPWGWWCLTATKGEAMGILKSWYLSRKISKEPCKEGLDGHIRGQAEGT